MKGTPARAYRGGLSPAMLDLVAGRIDRHVENSFGSGARYPNGR